MKKLLILSSFPAPYRVDVFKGLSQKYDVDVFFATDRDQDRSKDFFVKQNEFEYNVLSCKKAHKKLKICINRLNEYDLVLAYDWYLGFALKILLKCILVKIPYIINCDGAFIETNNGIKGKIKSLVKTFFVKNAAYCFSSGNFATRYFIHYGARRDRIVEHHFSSLKENEIRKAPLTDTEKEKIKLELGLSTLKCVVTVGQFIHRKGFDVLLEAWKKLDKQYQLVIIGGGSLEGDYKKFIMENNLKNVKLINFIPKNQVLRYLEAANVFALPTREDIWGLVINEALAVGIPVITTDKCIAGMELLNNGDCGYIIPVDDVGKMTERIEFILKMDENDRWELGLNGIGKMKLYTIESIVKDHCNVIDSITV